jgi:transposase InsO family protein
VLPRLRKYLFTDILRVGAIGLEGPAAKAKRRYKATTDSDHDLPVPENRVAQRFEAQQPNAPRLSDITYLRTQEGWLYLCCVLDLFTREIVGWAMKPSMRGDLIIDVLTMAKFSKRPGSGVIVHSDCGSAYASHRVREWRGQKPFV